MNEVRLVLFVVNGLPFGVIAEDIEEVIEYGRSSSTLPTSENNNRKTTAKQADNKDTNGKDLNPFIEDHINLRGNLISAVNLGRCIGIENAEVPLDAKILVAKTNEMLVGFIVDNVTSILELDETCIKDAPNIIMTPQNKCIKNFAIHDGSIFPIIRFSDIIGKIFQ